MSENIKFKARESVGKMTLWVIAYLLLGQTIFLFALFNAFISNFEGDFTEKNILILLITISLVIILCIFLLVKLVRDLFGFNHFILEDDTIICYESLFSLKRKYRKINFTYPCFFYTDCLTTDTSMVDHTGGSSGCVFTLYPCVYNIYLVDKYKKDKKLLFSSCYKRNTINFLEILKRFYLHIPEISDKGHVAASLGGRFPNEAMVLAPHTKRLQRVKRDVVLFGSLMSFVCMIAFSLMAMGQWQQLQLSLNDSFFSQNCIELILFSIISIGLGCFSIYMFILRIKMGRKHKELYK